MVKTSYAWSIVSLLLVMLMSSAAWAATITGTVTNTTGRTGRIYVFAERTDDHSRSFGTSIAAAGSFTISGVIPEEYVLRAFVDTQGSGIQHANDPRGASAPLTVEPTTTTIGGVNITVTDPPLVSLQQPNGTVYGGSGANLVKWVGPVDSNNFPIAESYTVHWSGANPPTAVETEAETVRSGYDDVFLHRGGASTLSYRITAHLGTNDSVSSAWIKVVSPPAAQGSITGTVSFPGVTATGPLFVAAIDETADPTAFRVVAIGSKGSPPTSPASYTISDVPANLPGGKYNLIAFLDQNDNGSFDIEDAGMIDTNDYTPTVTVASAQVSAPAIALEGGDAATIISTGHGKSSSAEWFNLVLTAQSMGKQLVGVTLTGPQLAQEVTLGLQKNGQFHTRIPMGRQRAGDAYQAELQFADGTTRTVTEQVTAVLNGFATPVAPVGNIVYDGSPEFRWTAPSPPPAGSYLYSIWLTDASGAPVWNAWALPSGVTSVNYGGTAPLQNGTRYNWIINVTDANGNMTAREVSFTPTTSPALSSFTPAGGPVATDVTITGVNFPATSALNVRFGSVPATITSSTGSSITTRVPPGAVTGKIFVEIEGNPTPLESEKEFYVGQPITISGVVQREAGTPFPGARVEILDSPTVSGTTNAEGRFSLTPVFPGQAVTLWITANGYVPTYSVEYPMAEPDNQFLNGNLMDLSQHPFHLYTQDRLNQWGVTGGRGMIVGQVLIPGLEPFPGLSGATVTTDPAYTVDYYDGTSITGTSTYGNGAFMVFDVPEQSIGTSGQKTGWTFYPGNFAVRAGSVTEGAFFASTVNPSIVSFTPHSGKRGSTVTITGVNISGGVSQTAVRFGAVPAEVTAVNGNVITVTVPATAVTSDIFLTNQGVETTLTNQPFTLLHTLTVGVSGGGTVNSVPTGIACDGTTGCTADFTRGSTVRLNASASGGNTFTGWSGASCTGTGSCDVVMNSDLSVSAIFTPDNAIRIGSTFYNTLASALTAAPPGSRIEMQAGTFPISTLGVNKTVKIVGGYNSTFTSNTGFTSLLGTLLAEDGLLRVERIKVR